MRITPGLATALVILVLSSGCEAFKSSLGKRGTYNCSCNGTSCHCTHCTGEDAECHCRAIDAYPTRSIGHDEGD